MVGFHRCSFTGSVFCRSALPRVGSPWRAELVARPGCRLHSTVVATYLSGKQDGDSDTEFRARNAQSWPVGELLQLVGETLVRHWWDIGETWVKHMRLFQPVFFCFSGQSSCRFLHHSLSRRSSLSLSLVLESPAQLFRSMTCYILSGVIKRGLLENHQFIYSWFSQLQSSIYSGFPVAMFDYQRVVYNSIHIYI